MFKINFQIICGDPDATSLIRSHCSTWFQFLVAQLIYTDPTVKKHSLSLYAHRSVAKYFEESEYNHMDTLALDLFDGDLEAVWIQITKLNMSLILDFFVNKFKNKF